MDNNKRNELNEIKTYLVQLEKNIAEKKQTRFFIDLLTVAALSIFILVNVQKLLTN